MTAATCCSAAAVLLQPPPCRGHTKVCVLAGGIGVYWGGCRGGSWPPTSSNLAGMCTSGRLLAVPVESYSNSDLCVVWCWVVGPPPGVSCFAG